MHKCHDFKQQCQSLPAPEHHAAMQNNTCNMHHVKLSRHGMEGRRAGTQRTSSAAQVAEESRLHTRAQSDGLLVVA